MKLNLITIAKRAPDWVQAACDEYTKRFAMPWQFTIKNVPNDVRMLEALPQKGIVLALDERGEAWSTNTLAKKLEHWQQSAGEATFLIGGAEGLTTDVKARATDHWSLSALTLPHQLAKIICVEQLYRAYTILHNHPYHRAGERK